MFNLQEKNKDYLKIIISILIIVFLLKTNLIYPFKVLLVYIHEMGHTISTLITGGMIYEIEVSSIHKGHTISTGGNQILIFISGYISTSIIGALFLKIETKRSSLILITFILLSSLFFIPYFVLNLNFVISIFTIIFISSLYYININHLTLNKLLGLLLLSQSIIDANNYLIQIPYQTDPGLLAKHLGLEMLTLPISFAFLILNTLIWYLILKKRDK